MPTEKEIEAAARAIAYAHDLDPDDPRADPNLKKPAWKIKWILDDARAALTAAEQVRLTTSPPAPQAEGLSEAIVRAQELYKKREDQLSRGNHYDAGQTWAAFQKEVCRAWPDIFSYLTASHAAGGRSYAEGIEERIGYWEKHDLHNGWRADESGPCCEQCALTPEHLTGRADALKARVGCRDPFQVNCGCHLLARQAIKNRMIEELTALLALSPKPTTQGGKG